MSRLEKVTLATTHLDRHNERFAVSALEGMVKQIATSYLPMGIEHDPRYPPMGRLIDAEVVGLPEGEHAVVGTIELFDEEPAAGDGRSIPIDVPELDRFRVGYDRSVTANDSRGDVEALAKLSGIEPMEMGKKGLEPLAILVIGAGLFAVTNIAGGFFSKIGADGWDALKRLLTARYSTIRPAELLELAIGVSAGERVVEVLILAPNPGGNAVSELFDDGLSQADSLVEYALQRESELARIVIVWAEGVARLAYAVRVDGVPVLVDWALIPPLPEKWMPGA